ncbi:MAG: rhodanese-like domain-containing protein [Alphaproteobacteria bacterium]|nr:rhodanese-like domain-containing protein [Alphaproteobacteria bacterium]
MRSTYTYRLLIALCIGIFSMAGSPRAGAQNVEASVNTQDIGAAVSEKKPVFFLDVRQPNEYAEGHIDNAVLIPLGDLERRYVELPKDKEIVVYCHSGGRSAMAVQLLRQKGFKNLVNLEGGYSAWVKNNGKK